MYLAYRFWLTVEDDTDIAQNDRGFYTQLLRCGHRVWYRVWSHLRNNEGCDWRWHWRKLFRGQNVALSGFRNVPNEDHHIPSPFMENWAIVWHMGYRYSNVTIWGIIISVWGKFYVALSISWNMLFGLYNRVGLLYVIL